MSRAVIALIWASLLVGCYPTENAVRIWCGDDLCTGYSKTGDVTRGRSWHPDDPAAVLGSADAVLELRTQDDVDRCDSVNLMTRVPEGTNAWLTVASTGRSEDQQVVPIAPGRWRSDRLTIEVQGPLTLTVHSDGTAPVSIARLFLTGCEVVHRPDQGLDGLQDAGQSP